MSITEQDRIRLYQHFEEKMGAELASKMMDSLPPARWGDLATKHDIEQFREYVDLRFEACEHKFGRTLYRALLVQTFTLASFMLGIATAADVF